MGSCRERKLVRKTVATVAAGGVGTGPRMARKKERDGDTAEKIEQLEQGLGQGGSDELELQQALLLGREALFEIHNLPPSPIPTKESKIMMFGGWG